VHGFEVVNINSIFRFLTGDRLGAKKEFEDSLVLNPALIQTWAKLASVHMEMEDPRSAFHAFESALKSDADDPDIYYHRGQGTVVAQPSRQRRLILALQFCSSFATTSVPSKITQSQPN
jgi:hypothetical protein